MLGALLRNRESLLEMEDSMQNWHLPRHTRFSPAWIPGGSLRDQFHKQIPVTLPQGAGQGRARLAPSCVPGRVGIHCLRCQRFRV